jgi:hypothetical protein
VAADVAVNAMTGKVSGRGCRGSLEDCGVELGEHVSSRLQSRRSIVEQSYDESRSACPGVKRTRRLRGNLRG